MIYCEYESNARTLLCIQGPNYVWHCDGMGKLKPYGFAIHGCIDGYVYWYV